MGGQYWDDVRSTMNRWFEHVPPVDREKLKGKLLGRDSPQFRSAFWELFLHETFICAGFDVLFRHNRCLARLAVKGEQRRGGITQR
jgi:hypothetical protein